VAFWVPSDFSERISLANLNVCVEERVAFSQTNMLSYVFAPQPPTENNHDMMNDGRQLFFVFVCKLQTNV